MNVVTKKRKVVNICSMLAHPNESVRQVVYPVVNEQTLRKVVVEYQYRFSLFHFLIIYS